MRRKETFCLDILHYRPALAGKYYDVMMGGRAYRR